jgi:Copper binding periplasmic protein CusF
MIRAMLLASMLLALSACKAKPPVKTYPMHGTVISVNQADHYAMIQSGKIGDWMDAMTMEFPVKDNREFQKLKPGENITATVHIQEAAYWIDNIHDVSKTAPTAGKGQ